MPAALLALLCLLLWMNGCSRQGGERPLFKLLSSAETGVTFENTITTSDSVNVQNDVYVYNGAGVAIGDIDNDGLPDLFFSGNMVSSRLYLNKGRMRFEDITTPAGVATRQWATGATMVDINSDGFLDIYVSVTGTERTRPEERANLLFINNGNRTFTESAAQYGLGDTGFTIHAAFLDYDADGCLDVFLLNNSPRDFARGEAARGPSRSHGDTPDSYNQLYRNNCQGAFTNVSREAGILRGPGYGLGVVVADLNNDGRPDIYVSNDATPNDVLYVNNGNGTFTNKAAQWLKHTSFAGMGVDAADFNNDGWTDILQVDMLPSDAARRKRMSGFMTYNGLLESRSRGLRDDYSVNTLQLSNGVTRDGDVLFSDVAAMAGVAATDWSWSALFADFDNDGHKDIFIGNGYPKAVNDLDYQQAMFAVRRSRDTAASHRNGLDILTKLHTYELPNRVFRNSGDLTFADKTREWGMERASLSYGAAYADLDTNGTLDLVVNNIDAPAFIYENVGAVAGDSARHFLQVKLQGESPNVRGIGAKLVVTAGGQKQYVEHTPYRGYMSTMDDRAHFGLGHAARVDSLEVYWPDGRSQVVTGLEADRLVVVNQALGSRPSALGNRRSAENPLFQPQEPREAIAYQHRAETRVDYSVQPLLHYMVSRQGPAIAVGDVTGDGLDDLYVGGTSQQPGMLFLQQADGRFVGQALLTSREPSAERREPLHEDWGATFLDANGDGRLDLYVASGGYYMPPGSQLLQDRLYVNQGGGRFTRDPAALPPMLTSTAAVRAGDFNGDGRPDLFVGGRLTPRDYPVPTRSFVLRNDGGRFTDVTEEVAPELVEPGGMITDAAWIDFDGDKRLDLVTVGEWMPIQFYRNDGTRLRDATKATGLPPMRGWWNSLATGDFDGDGRIDLAAGNLGLNSPFRTSAQSRFGMYAADLTGNRTTSIILTEETAGTEHPVAGLVPLGREIYSLGLRFKSYESFAQAPMAKLLSPDQMKRSIHYQTDTFASVFLRSEGNGRFSSTALPNLAQIAPINGMVAHDVDGDGHLDLIVAGNRYDVEPNTPRADAGNGLWLRGDGKGGFTPMSPRESGLLAPGNVTGLALIRTRTGRSIVVGNYGDSLRTFGIRR
jgi:enediyne biosynthesis protein E4